MRTDDFITLNVKIRLIQPINKFPFMKMTKLYTSRNIKCSHWNVRAHTHIHDVAWVRERNKSEYMHTHMHASKRPNWANNRIKRNILNMNKSQTIMYFSPIRMQLIPACSKWNNNKRNVHESVGMNDTYGVRTERESESEIKNDYDCNEKKKREWECFWLCACVRVCLRASK